MFKKLAVCLVIASLILCGGVYYAAATETIKGIGVSGIKTPLDRIAMRFTRDNPAIRIVTTEGANALAIETVGKGARGYTFGMITRPLNDKEKAAYPDIRTFLFAKDGVAIIVHPDNPVKGLTSAQVRDIYLGRIRNWAEVGGERGPIMAIRRETGSGQRLAVEGVVMGGTKIPPGTGREIGSMGGVRTEVGLDESAIGYILIGAVDRTVKALKLDGVAATADNVKIGAYPIAIPFFLITKGEPTGATKTFIDHMMGPTGQREVTRERLSPAVR